MAVTVQLEHVGPAGCRITPFQRHTRRRAQSNVAVELEHYDQVDGALGVLTCWHAFTMSAMSAADDAGVDIVLVLPYSNAYRMVSANLSLVTSASEDSSLEELSTQGSMSVQMHRRQIPSTAPEYGVFEAAATARAWENDGLGTETWHGARSFNGSAFPGILRHPGLTDPAPASMGAPLGTRFEFSVGKSAAAGAVTEAAGYFWAEFIAYLPQDAYLAGVSTPQPII